MIMKLSMAASSFSRSATKGKPTAKAEASLVMTIEVYHSAKRISSLETLTRISPVLVRVFVSAS